MTSKIVAAALLAAVGAWFYMTPYSAYSAMAKAAENRDATTLARYVDFAALKESVKANLGARFGAHVVRQGESDPAAALGAAFASALINPMVEAMVTPDSLTAMIRNGVPPSGDAAGNPAAAESRTETTRGYEGFNRFVVKVRQLDRDREPVVFVFHREGLISWKLSAMRLPF
ncbi:MAG: hypothetical protein NFCOHLIN_03056 [Gammaproteobacteria bacterium]|nr:hypothetical protein [Gammaproteobacteria bacterium]